MFGTRCGFGEDVVVVLFDLASTIYIWEGPDDLGLYFSKPVLGVHSASPPNSMHILVAHSFRRTLFDVMSPRKRRSPWRMRHSQSFEECPLSLPQAF